MTLFLSYLINGISLGSVYAIIALGYTMVYGIAKMLNFAHGDVIMIGAYVSFCAMQYLGLPALVSVVLAMVACTALGIIIEGFDTRLAEGLMMLTPFAADAQDEKTVSFVTKYQEQFGGVPNQFAADAYDGIYALAAACEKAGVTADTSVEDACDMVIAAMQEIQVEGLTGTMTWDATGSVTKTPTAVVIKDGAYVSAE